MSPEITVQKEITPEEVHAIADAVRQCADRAHEIAKKVEGVGEELDGSWMGRAKDLFFLHYEPVPRAIDHFAGSLNSKASAIEAIRVIIEIIQWVEDLFTGGSE